MKPFFRAAMTALACVSLLSGTQTFAENKQSNKISADIKPEERAKIEAVVHDYLLEKPEIVVEALQTMQRKQYEEAEKTIKNTRNKAAEYSKQLFSQKDDPVYGNENGKITVTEFFDYQCPHCVAMAPVIEAVVKDNNNVRVVYKEFPIRGPVSEYAARVALAAKAQGKYYEVHHAILTAKPPLSKEGIDELAKNTGLDMEKLKKDMNSQSVDQQIDQNRKLGRELKLFGTPAFFIGKTDGKGNVEYVPGQMNETQMQEVIKKLDS